jgi:hypothetical protein
MLGIINIKKLFKNLIKISFCRKGGWIWRLVVAIIAECPICEDCVFASSLYNVYRVDRLDHSNLYAGFTRY